MSNQSESYQQIQNVIDEMEKGIKDVFTSEKYLQCLKTYSLFHHYSFNNCMLILSQYPNAQRVAPLNVWNKLERSVIPGEKAIKIIAPSPYRKKIVQDKIDPNTNQPMTDGNGNPLKEEREIVIQHYHLTSVFDVNQTQGKDLPKLTEELKGETEQYDALIKHIRSISPAKISFYDMEDSDTKGCFYPESNRIVIKKGMSQIQTLKTMFHELAHAMLHNDTKPDVEKSTEQKEIEAESIAYILADRYGMDTSDYSFPYIASWSKDKDLSLLKDSMLTIKSTSAMLIHQIDEQMRNNEKSATKSTYKKTTYQKQHTSYHSSNKNKANDFHR